MSIFGCVGENVGFSSGGYDSYELEKRGSGGGDCMRGSGGTGTPEMESLEDTVGVSGNGYSKQVVMENGVPTISEGEWRARSDRLGT